MRCWPRSRRATSRRCTSSTRSTRWRSTDGETPAEALARLQKKYPSAVFVSGLTGEGVDALIDRIGEEAARGSLHHESAGAVHARRVVRLAHERAQVVSERHTEDGTHLVLRVPLDLVPAFERVPGTRH